MRKTFESAMLEFKEEVPDKTLFLYLFHYQNTNGRQLKELEN